MHLGIALLMGLFSFSAVMITLQAAAFRDSEIINGLAWIRGRVAGGSKMVRGTATVFGERIAPVISRPAAQMRAVAALDVYYDDWCPRCAHICRVGEKLDWLGLVTFIPIRRADTEFPIGIAPGRLLSRMHVRRVWNGETRSGAAAMAALSARIPSAAPLWPLLAFGSALGVGEWMYDKLARGRAIIPVAVCAGIDCPAESPRIDLELPRK